MAVELAIIVLFQVFPEDWPRGSGGACLEISEGVGGLLARRHIINGICVLSGLTSRGHVPALNTALKRP